MLLARTACFVENLVRFAGGEALVPQMDGQAGELAECGGEGLGFGCLGARLAGKMDGIADDDGGHGEAAREARQGAQVFSGDGGRGATALEREHRLRREAQLVGDGHADASVADVEAEIAGFGFQLFCSQKPSYCALPGKEIPPPAKRPARYNGRERILTGNSCVLNE